MIKIIDGIQEKCQTCPRFTPTLNDVNFYTDNGVVEECVEVLCKNRDICDGIEEYLTGKAKE